MQVCDEYGQSIARVHVGFLSLQGVVLSLQQLQVTDFFRPTNSEDSSKADVYKSLDFLHCVNCCSLSFCSIQNNWLHHGVKDPDLGF